MRTLRVELLKLIYHSSFQVTLEGKPSMLRSSRIDGNDAVSLSGEHMHPQLPHALKITRPRYHV